MNTDRVADFSISGSSNGNFIWVDSTTAVGMAGTTGIKAPEQKISLVPQTTEWIPEPIYLKSTGVWGTGSSTSVAVKEEALPLKKAPTLQVESGEVVLKGNAVLKLEAAKDTIDIGTNDNRTQSLRVEDGGGSLTVDSKIELVQSTKEKESSGFPLVLGLLALGGAMAVKVSATKKAQVATKKQVQKA